MRIILAIAAIIALLAAPAYAQKFSTAKEEAAKEAKDKKKEHQEVEKQYNDAVKRMKDAPSQKMDPWANMR